MSRNAIVYWAWGSAIGVLGAFGALAFLIVETLEARSNFAARAAYVATRDGASAESGRLRALLRDTRREREMLAALAEVDVLAAVGLVEGIAAFTGTAAAVEGATTVTGSPREVEPVIIIVSFEGDLLKLQQTLEFLEVLPLLSTVETLEMQQIPGVAGGGKSWRMTTRVKVIIARPT